MKIMVSVIATTLQFPLIVIVIVFRCIGEAFIQICIWSCYLLAKMFNYAGDYQAALEWIKIAGMTK